MANTYEKLGEYNPSELPDRASNLTASEITDTTLVLNWTNHTLVSEYPTAVNVVQVWIDTKWVTTDIGEIPLDVDEQLIFGLDEGTNYRIRVCVLLDNVLFPSIIIQPSTLTIPKPQNLTVDTLTTSGGTLHWDGYDPSWENVLIQKYDGAIPFTVVDTIAATETDYVITDMASGENAFYAVGCTVGGVQYSSYPPTYVEVQAETVPVLAATNVQIIVHDDTTWQYVWTNNEPADGENKVWVLVGGNDWKELTSLGSGESEWYMNPWDYVGWGIPMGVHHETYIQRTVYDGRDPIDSTPYIDYYQPTPWSPRVLSEGYWDGDNAVFDIDQYSGSYEDFNWTILVDGNWAQDIYSTQNQFSIWAGDFNDGNDREVICYANKDGNYSSPSNTVIFNFTKPKEPTNLAFVSATDSRIVVSWTNNHGGGYNGENRLYVNGILNKTSDQSLEQRAATGLDPETEYEITCSWYDLDQSTEYWCTSPTGITESTTKSYAPTGVTATYLGMNTFGIEWEYVDGLVPDAVDMVLEVYDTGDRQQQYLPASATTGTISYNCVFDQYVPAVNTQYNVKVKATYSGTSFTSDTITPTTIAVPDSSYSPRNVFFWNAFQIEGDYGVSEAGNTVELWMDGVYSHSESISEFDTKLFINVTGYTPSTWYEIMLVVDHSGTKYSGDTFNWLSPVEDPVVEWNFNIDATPDRWESNANYAVAGLEIDQNYPGGGSWYTNANTPNIGSRKATALVGAGSESLYTSGNSTIENLVTGSAFTVSVWGMLWDNTSEHLYFGVVSNNNTSLGGGSCLTGIQLGTADYGTTKYLRRDGTDDNVGGWEMTAQQWEMITIVYDGTDTKWYRNDELMHTRVGSEAISARTYDIVVGCSNTGNVTINVDNLQAWDKALSQEEIKRLYEQITITT